VITGIVLGMTFTGIIAFFGVRWVIFIYGTGQISPDLEWPMWIIYLAIPLGSGLMSYRFYQSLMKFLKHGQTTSAGPVSDLREGALDVANSKEQAK
jgi:C4-dicarboxylate transporter DctQ subunit